jgi:hypothetical protein
MCDAEDRKCDRLACGIQLKGYRAFRAVALAILLRSNLRGNEIIVNQINLLQLNAENADQIPGAGVISKGCRATNLVGPKLRSRKAEPGGCTLKSISPNIFL